MKNARDILARRYARAFINQFDDKLTEEMIERLPAIAEVLEKHRGMLMYASLQNTELKSKEKIEELFEKAGFNTLFLPLIELVIGDKRLLLLPRILRSLYSLYLEKHDIMHFTIESAIELTQKEQDDFVDFLKRKTDKKIRYTLRVNPALIAGVKMYSNTLCYEHSIQQRLDQIHSGLSI